MLKDIDRYKMISDEARQFLNYISGRYSTIGEWFATPTAIKCVAKMSDHSNLELKIYMYSGDKLTLAMQSYSVLGEDKSVPMGLLISNYPNIRVSTVSMENVEESLKMIESLMKLDLLELTKKVLDDRLKDAYKVLKDRNINYSDEIAKDPFRYSDAANFEYDFPLDSRINGVLMHQVAKLLLD